MKQTKNFIAFQDKENGHFVSEYKHRKNRLAYEAGLCNSIQDALTFGCHIVVVEATHEIKMLDGSDVPEPEERNSQSGFLDLLEALSK